MKDIHLRVWGQLTISVVSFFFFYLSSVTEGNISLAKLIFYVVFTTFIVWEGVRLSILLSRSLYPGIQHLRKRFALTAILTLLIVTVIPPIKFWIGDLIRLYGDEHQAGNGIARNDYLRIMGQNIFYCLFIAAIYEATYFFALWKQTFMKNESLAKQKLMTQLDSLKMQMSPHFLFNTLNTLTSLIRRDSNRAEQFVEEMAAVYRYLLTVNEKDLVTLGEELEFVDSYATLLQTRFANFSIQLRVDPELNNSLLPPLTLQLLIENAVKHNIANEAYPLVLEMYTEGEQLIIQNPVQRKHGVRSEKKGLANIHSRFMLLGLKPVTINESASVFQVRIPLLQTSEYAGTDH